MKLTTLFLIGAMAFLTPPASAQNENLECDSVKLLALEAIANDDYKTAVTHLLKAETNCGGLDKDYWHRLIGSLKTVVNKEAIGSEVQKQYIDTVLRAWVRQELLELYNASDDLTRATYIMQSAAPDYQKADFLFRRGIQEQGLETHESYLVYAYYTTYLIWNNAEQEKKSKFKQQMLSDYLHYSDIVDKTECSEATQETLDIYFEYAFPTCEEILPEVSTTMESLPKDTVLALQQVKQMESLLDDRYCIQNSIYPKLIDTWLELDPNSFYARLNKIQITTNGGIEMMDSVLVYVKDSMLREEILYQKAYAEYKVGQYRKAYSSGLKCTSNNKSKGLLLAAQSVAALANSCGDSTFDRKCNYIYAAQLAEEAGNSELASRLRSKGPVVDCPNENDSQPVYLSCWDITINVCP